MTKQLEEIRKYLMELNAQTRFNMIMHGRGY